MDKRVVPVIFFSLLIIFGAQLYLSTLDKSVTGDETGHSIRGYYLVKTGNMMIYGHPPAVHYLTVPFLAFEDINLPEEHEMLYLKNDIQMMASRILFNSGNDADMIVFLARLPIIMLAVILGIFVFKLAKDLYGVNAGLFALFLYSFSPIVLSLGGIITTDFAATFFIFLAVYAYWKMLKKMTKLRVAIAGIAFALAIATRLVAFVLIPIFVILGASYYYEHKEKIRLKKFLVSFIAIMFIGYFTINLLYGFDGTFKSLGQNLEDDPSLYVDKTRYNPQTISELAPQPVRSIVRFVIEKVPVMAPYPFLKDVFSIPAIAANTTSMFYVLGKFSTGIWYYLPLTLLIKLHLLVLTSLALSVIFFRKLRSSITSELMLILPFVFITGFFMFFIAIETGIRYLLPTLPFLFVFVSKVVNLRSRIVTVGLVVLSISYIISALTIFPAYSAYYNEFAGGPDNGYKVIPGANIDTGGENMLRLKNYMEEKGISEIKLSYGGFSDPDYYGINREADLPSVYQVYRTNFSECGPTTGIVVVAVSNLVGLHMENRTCFSWLESYEPIDKIGYSLFVYNITE